MIRRDELDKPSWLRRSCLRLLGRQPEVGAAQGFAGRLLGESAFALAIKKEICRCDRRSHDREFCLLKLQAELTVPEKHHRLIEVVSNRLRITDELGMWENELCVLCPETDAAGGAELGRQLEDLALKISVKLRVVVRVWPWDDRIASRSDELIDAARGAEGSRQMNSDRIAAGTVEIEEADLARRAFLSGDADFLQSAPTPWWKRAFDIAGAGLGLVIVSPVLLAAALAIRLDSPGPVLFFQLREGKDGKTFRIVKFRTMRPDAEEHQKLLADLNEQDGPAFKIEADPRVTQVGRYLRKTCIDELPQLWNVLRGEMSMVGPRPLPVNESYAARTWHRRRLTVLPGLTCIWQVSGGRRVTFDQWMRMDLEYIRRRSFWFDLQLIARTALVVIAHRGSV